MNVQTSLDDPLLVVLTWAMTYVFSQSVKDKTAYRRLRHIIPAFALLMAIFLRVLGDQITGTPLTVEALLRAVAAAGVAVLTHSQVREIQKARTEHSTERSG